MIVSCCELCVVLRGGAVRPAPTTPATMANIARCSSRPACSPSIRRERRLHHDQRGEQQRQ